MELIPKQEKFCQCIVSGTSYKDSYLTAYDWNGSDKRALKESARMALKENIRARITKLQKTIETTIGKTRYTSMAI